MTKNEDRTNKLFEELVPASGKAENLAGELVRAMAASHTASTTTVTRWASATVRRPATPQPAS